MHGGWIARHPLMTVLALLLVLGFLVNVTNDEDSSGGGTRGSVAGPSDDSREDRVRDRREPPRSGTDTQRDDPRRDRPKGQRPGKPQRTYLVTRIVDGDTIELGNGETVRLVGIDTPEVGECGFERSSEVLAQLVLNEQVRLTVSDEDRDQYGRLLRYVDVGTLDAGLRLIKRGLAIARYDSRDGYGYHPRERVYIAADERSPDVGCPKPRTLVQAPPQGGGNCAPGYRPCIPPYPPDLDCADVDGPIYVTGPDPHQLDADGDGVACEWG